VHAAVSGQGQAVRLVLTGGERHDLIAAPSLLEGLSVRNVIGDKGYDSDSLREQIRRQGGHPVIPSRSGHRHRRHDKEKYKLRNVIERFFNRLKHCRRVATRYDKTARNYFSFVCIGAAMITF
jgi:transposase